MLITGLILSYIFLIVSIALVPKLFEWNLEREMRACERRGR